MARKYRLVLLLTIMSVSVAAQDTLPKFTAKTRGNNRVIISWTNLYPVVTQINIQRSLDSTRNFQTILAVPDPHIPQNGFVDTKATTPYMFYRLFIVLDSGKYLFTRSKRAFWDTAKVVRPPVEKNNLPGNKRVIVSDSLNEKEAEKIREKLSNLKVPDSIAPEEKKPEKIFIVKRLDSIVTEFPESNFRQFRDSIVNKTRDTLVFRTADTIVIKPFVPKVVYKPSQYVFTEKEGNVMIVLPEAKSKLYSVRFFEENNSPLFEIQQVKEPLLTLDKANFLHAGWFRFELYEEGKLKEKHRLYIPKEF
ncbi:MAG TPA: hypothetical protein VM012_02370 [Flavitalea sp.]|nr:hypothetical protein [Flavitalea sp.]